MDAATLIIASLSSGAVTAIFHFARIHHWTHRALKAEAALARIEATIAKCEEAAR